MCSHSEVQKFTFMDFYKIKEVTEQRFFRGTHGRFLHIINELAADDEQATTSFLYLTEDDLSALSGIAKELLARRKVAICPTSNASTQQPFLYPVVAHTYSTPTA